MESNIQNEKSVPSQDDIAIHQESLVKHESVQDAEIEPVNFLTSIFFIIDSKF